MNFLSKTLWLPVGIGTWVICFNVGRSISPLGEGIGVVLGAVLGWCAAGFVGVKCSELADEQIERKEKLKAAELGKVITPDYVLNVITSTETEIQKQHTWETRCKERRVVWSILVSEVYESAISGCGESSSHPHSIRCYLASSTTAHEKLLTLKKGVKVQVLGKITGDLPRSIQPTIRLEDVSLV